MIFDAEDFSQFEYCPRKPELDRTFRPPRYPIRDAVKQYFKTGIRGLMAGESPEETTQAFIREASVPGYAYPETCEPYTAAKDHESWLDGALRIIKEETAILEQLPLFKVGEHHVHVEGWQDGERVHIFRASTNLGERGVKWPELCIAGLDGRETEIHVFKMPSTRNGRLLSPLSMAYQHPTFQNIQYRLARIYDEPEFNKNWKKIARWEIQPQPTWDEWRLGIERDKCLPLIRESYTISPILDDEARRRIVYDIEQMCNAQQKPSIFPRYRERCASCYFNGLCHGNEESRSEYEVVNRK